MAHYEPHIFVFWVADFSAHAKNPGDLYAITDKHLINRIATIVRLRVGEQCILFDRERYSTVEIISIQHKQLVVRIMSINHQDPYKPHITALLPILKKDDLSSAVEGLTAVGVSTIQLVTTVGGQRTWGGKAEYNRLERVMIAAAEQAKTFSLPQLCEPRPLIEVVPQSTQENPVIFCDPMGAPVATILTKLSAHIANCYLMVGPEQDLDNSEKKYLTEQYVQFCALTPTVLRSYLAITVVVAMVRSWYNR